MQKTVNVIEESPQKNSKSQRESEVEVMELQDSELAGLTPNRKRGMSYMSSEGDGFKAMKVVGCDSRDVAMHMFVPHKAEAYSLYYAP